MLIAAAWWHPILATLFAFLAVILMGIILLQRGKGVGLAGAFGGAGGSTAFGAKTGDFLTWATVVIAGVFMLYTIVCNFAFMPPKAGLTPAAPPPSAPVGGAQTPPAQPPAQPRPAQELPAPPPPAESPTPPATGEGGASGAGDETGGDPPGRP
ncbi:MAG: preprotein translocase subunit SecG [Phycisphaerae bacterium]|nr:preprotein translocase subunit SecG [Phycisphaerae bacterium]MCZ2399999.1 preprotein translocase subunit SecG [Phycisphaerae bacterium]NUQ49108.1 preprotein translocase subunit SecG [Phycisphaerae bacterium]